ncbi:glycosyltransferase family 2 protein [Chitinophaga arvensicola]|uniref:Glycosyltransferase, catalytic subunit of cellulose synthase and poly-beta-1,6-N-acetylglucosamine synthase n=1 Tax=Chitinophaga arvensicola TaxID=29529 RepID=A0A1I0S5H3_9BACT|nr:glycosyltransferase family 2 protein [Chitinophaga arvensicola]SEW50330.1 Glycosyltransferase, catalytic subunit of cellulose synthase and poly-beta-1,6-N-acetylglucosamine synthase [Chitinophaga arvensicola]
MKTTTIVFWISMLIVFYNYIGYGVILYLLVKLKGRTTAATDTVTAFEPAATLVIAAYNEEDFIAAKIRNTFELDYPKEKFRIIIITDGSTDRTPDLVARHPGIQLLHEPARNGKTAALNRAMQLVDTPIVIFCDANTLLNKSAIRNIVKHYADETIGGVAGEKKIIYADRENSAAAGEGIYWKYESFLKKLDAEYYSVVGAAGELFSIRTALYQPVEKEVILDDFIISLRINQRGYRIAYAPDAYAMETPSADIKEEHKRKVRISAGGFQAIIKLASLLNFFRHPKLTFQYISHRVLRWTLSPLGLLLLLITNVILVINAPSPWWYTCLAAQLAFYAMALIGYSQAEKQVKNRFFQVPFYFLFMNIAVYQGFYRYLKGNQSSSWEKSKRK